MVKEHPFWTCDRIGSMIAGGAFGLATKGSIAATASSGPFALIVAPVAFVATIGVTEFTYHIHYEACLGIKKEIAEQQKKGRLTWKGFHGDDFDWAGN